MRDEGEAYAGALHAAVHRQAAPAAVDRLKLRSGPGGRRMSKAPAAQIPTSTPEAPGRGSCSTPPWAHSIGTGSPASIPEPGEERSQCHWPEVPPPRVDRSCSTTAPSSDEGFSGRSYSPGALGTSRDSVAIRYRPRGDTSSSRGHPRSSCRLSRNDSRAAGQDRLSPPPRSSSSLQPCPTSQGPQTCPGIPRRLRLPDAAPPRRRLGPDRHRHRPERSPDCRSSPHGRHSS